MTVRLATMPVLLVIGVLFALGNFSFGGPRELSRVRSDALAMSCEAGKTLLVRMDPAGQSAWIILPEREFRLDLTPGAADTRYSNGRTTLIIRGEQATLEESGAPSLANCRGPQA